MNVRKFITKTVFTVMLCMPALLMAQQSVSKVWVADNGDGTYSNPILHADYSDPDVVRVGDDFYMTSSSFNCVPGLPILHSKDLVNWELIGYGLNRLEYAEGFEKPQHGNGIWAPCIRYHNDEFYIYFPDPDHGIYMIKAKNAKGPWSDPVCVKAGKGLIDPTPLWDDDGKVYLAYAFAGSRATIKSVIMITELNSEGTAAKGQDVMVFDGHKDNPTVEGPKFYKRNGYYYIFAPAGGVSTGWQLAMRSKNIYGPYDYKVVMDQGKTKINGPHQGAWIDTPGGENWFIHFQDKEAYGRIVFLEPMVWKNDWPVIGYDPDGNGVGEPVSTHKKPDVGRSYPITTPPESDEFNTSTFGLQWQWHANPSVYWGFPSGNLGYFRLNCMTRPENSHGLWEVPDLLLQKFPAEEFTATTKITFNSYKGIEETGFVIMGEDYQYISLKSEDGKMLVRVVQCKRARTGGKETEMYSEEFDGNEIYFRITVKEGAKCTFAYSKSGKKYTEAGSEFEAKPGRWIGAKVGYFALRNDITNDSGTVDIDWFRIN
ncbi:glycoside hydrolase 43 family protein [Saccharicrinis sp. FJH62]|uniref:glycoside hydrolase family 43 protein n=1 Tax=Saccharicrinis sp. FJH62 TaxID=3344657 RepID=UPI0035D427AD